MSAATTEENVPFNGQAPVRAVPDSVGGPVPFAWREGTLTRARELQSLAHWLARQNGSPVVRDLLAGIDVHLTSARQAAEHGRRRFWRPTDGPLLERAISNLDAAQANLLHVAPADYVLGQMPSLLNEVQRHLPPNDPRRKEFERIALEVGVSGPDSALPAAKSPADAEARQRIVTLERSTIVSIVRGATSAALREQLRVRSFRNVLAVAAVVMALMAFVLAAVGWISPASVPLCFQPEQGGQLVVVCPTGQSAAVPAAQGKGSPQPQVDRLVNRTVRRADIAVVEVIGLIAAGVAAAAALRGIRGSSEPHGLPVVLALLKLPTGALTAVLGLLLMRGEFVPGLSALDTSGQILAWAIVFGYAQQLFTRFVDQQAHTVLDGVRGTRKAAPPE